MTEITAPQDVSPMAAPLSPTMRDVVLHWGEMGQAWGVNRSVGQIHALLYLMGRAMTADEIAETLGLARSNVSNSLKELQDWELVVRRHEFGDRRDFFIAKGELWDILITIVEGRKKREIDPTIELLARAAAASAQDRQTPPDVARRIQDMSRFVGHLSGWYDQVKTLPVGVLVKLMNMGARIGKFVSGG
jgi:DNA-binding transcriptional regulator GbsR (MarR family)